MRCPKCNTSEPSLLEHIANITSLSSPRKQLDLLLANYHQERQPSINEANIKIAARWITPNNSTHRLTYLNIWESTVGLNYLSRSIRMHFC